MRAKTLASVLILCASSAAVAHVSTAPIDQDIPGNNLTNNMTVDDPMSNDMIMDEPMTEPVAPNTSDDMMTPDAADTTLDDAPPSR